MVVFLLFYELCSMQEESGFFTTSDLSAEEASRGGGHDSYHDFRTLYTSQNGFCRLLLARRYGRLFAVKTLRPEYRGNIVAEAALRKEYDAAAMVDSTYVARTFDFVSLPDYGNSIILEYCPGETLRSLIDSGDTLTDAETDKITGGIAGALADIHAAGLIHRDIKPENIIYSRATGSLKVVDTGFADSDEFCILRAPAGTERYTPPERLTAPADTRNDLYSAGVVFSELCQIASPSRRKSLYRLSSALIKGRISDAGQISAAYSRLLSHTGLKKDLMIIVPAILAVCVIAVILFGRGTVADREVAVTNTDTVRISPKQTDSSLPAIQGPPRIEVSEKEKPAAAVAVAAETSEKADTASGKFHVPGILIPPEELVKNEYGVTMAEAKYLAIFGQSDFDNYVVQQTDNVIREARAIIGSRAPEDNRNKMSELLKSEEQVVEAVMAKVRAKYPEADMRRAKGLASQRWHFIFAGPLSLHYQQQLLIL